MRDDTPNQDIRPVKAVVLTAYGAPEVLQMQDVDTPIPKQDEVLVRVHATTVTAGDAEIRASKLHWLFWLLEAGTLEPVIDRSYAFDQIADAHRYVETGHKQGNVVMSL